ncbi:hypothetical protein JHK82_023980 [Glycine max]|nr:hypothetical protein JHK82_023980 [Glycine max]
MAPPPSDLRKIGAEGFALIDKLYAPPRRSSTVNEPFHGPAVNSIKKQDNKHTHTLKDHQLPLKLVSLVLLLSIIKSSMAPPTDLRVIASEGFDLIDRFYGPSAQSRPKRNGVFPSRQGPWVVQVPNDELEEPMSVINSRDAAARYGGITIVNYPKPQTRLARSFKP